MAEYDPKIVVIPKVGADVTSTAPFAVRETYRLYRLRAARAVVVVAADMEDEARALAARPDCMTVTGTAPHLHRPRWKKQPRNMCSEMS